MSRLTVSLLAAVALLVTGCATVPGGSPEPDAAIVEAHDCLAPNLGDLVFPPEASAVDRPPAPAPGRVPADFQPVTAYRCVLHSSVEDAEGIWSAVTVERFDGDLSALLTALAQPHDGSSPLMACTADMELVPPLWLADAAGRAVHVSYPRNACGKTKPATRDALEALTLTETVTLKGELVESRAAIDSGCFMGWWARILDWPAGVVAVEPGDAVINQDGMTVIPVGPPALPAANAVDGVRWCEYTAVDPAVTHQSEPTGAPGVAELDQHSGQRSPTEGRFARGGQLGPDAAGVVLAAASGQIVPDCGADATAFVVLFFLDDGVDTGATITVELDGCEHLIGPDGKSRAVPAELRQLLAER
ncbi:hypothetical protein [Salinibacterium sp. ZJ450]|uniref:hypothetical protein n=1 Tax=Salinibacterium sp. ZJ450 TaxID=2708338 RepID=UPI0014210A6A|nr:hypothetical protein [Salinibacterium sp. ZJ450]